MDAQRAIRLRSLRGIDRTARDIAADLAQRSGLTLKEWLNQLLIEEGAQAPGQSFVQRSEPQHEPAPYPGEEAAAVATALGRLTARIEASEKRSTLAIEGVEQSVAGLAAKLETGQREQTAITARFESAIDDLMVDLSRVVRRLEQVEEDVALALAVEPAPPPPPVIEAPPPVVEAPAYVDAALIRLAGRLDNHEAQVAETFTGLREELDGVHQQCDGLQEQLGVVHEQVSDAGAEAAKVFDAGLKSLQERQALEETRTGQVLRGVQGSLDAFDQRLRAAETRPATDDPALQRRAAEMAAVVLKSVEGRFDQIEGAQRDTKEQLLAAETRAANTAERIGREALSSADDLTRKLQGVEQRTAVSVGRLGDEISRIADALDSRLAQANIAGPVALEKMNAEFARITEALATRIGAAEQRAAKAVDEVSASVADVGRRLQEHQDAASHQRAALMRQVEEAGRPEHGRRLADREAAEARGDKLLSAPLFDAEAASRLLSEPDPAPTPEPDADPIADFPAEDVDPFVAHIASAKVGSRWNDAESDEHWPGPSTAMATDLFGVDAEEGRVQWDPAVETLVEHARAIGKATGGGDFPGDHRRSTFSWLLGFGKRKPDGILEG